MITLLKYMFSHSGRWNFPVTLAILLLFYSTGILGIAGPERDWFLNMTPLTLLLSLGLLLLNHQGWNKDFTWLTLACLLTGYLIEVVGVATGAIFGNYSYGSTLGFQLLGVPVMIAVNWMLLVMASGSILAEVAWPIWLKAIAGASLMTALDVLIEPVAVATDMWQWDGGEVPFQNYAAWWGIAFGLQWLYHSLDFKKSNKMGVALFGVQILFFGILNLIL